MEGLSGSRAQQAQMPFPWLVPTLIALIPLLFTAIVIKTLQTSDFINDYCSAWLWLQGKDPLIWTVAELERCLAGAPYQAYNTYQAHSPSVVMFIAPFNPARVACEPLGLDGRKLGRRNCRLALGADSNAGTSQPGSGVDCRTLCRRLGASDLHVSGGSTPLSGSAASLRRRVCWLFNCYQNLPGVVCCRTAFDTALSHGALGCPYQCCLFLNHRHHSTVVSTRIDRQEHRLRIGLSTELHRSFFPLITVGPGIFPQWLNILQINTSTFSSAGINLSLVGMIQRLGSNIPAIMLSGVLFVLLMLGLLRWLRRSEAWQCTTLPILLSLPLVWPQYVGLLNLDRIDRWFYAPLFLSSFMIAGLLLFIKGGELRPYLLATMPLLLLTLYGAQVLSAKDAT